MLNIELITLARAVHVLAGVAWAGATFLLAAVIVPIAARHGAEGAGRWTGIIARRVGPMSGNFGTVDGLVRHLLVRGSAPE
jgi:uncharacterized membrane protein